MRLPSMSRSATRDVCAEPSGAKRAARISCTRPARLQSHGDCRRSCNQDRPCWAKWLDWGATGPCLERFAPPDRSSARRIASQHRCDAHISNSLAYRLVAEIKTSALVDAFAAECIFIVAEVEEGLEIQGDRDLLLTAVANLLHNAFKYTRPHSEVSLNVYSAADRVIIDVADHCGGLPPGIHEELFLPFKRRSTDRVGLGLGLSICRDNVEANNGVLRVRNLAGSGCVFTIDLPR